MSDYRFGDDYRLNYDHRGYNPDDDCIDWDAVQWVEIDSTMFVRGRTCHMVPVSLYDEEGAEGIECSECGWSEIHDWDDPIPDHCPMCKRKVAPK